MTLATHLAYLRMWAAAADAAGLGVGLANAAPLAAALAPEAPWSFHVTEACWTLDGGGACADAAPFAAAGKVVVAVEFSRRGWRAACAAAAADDGRGLQARGSTPRDPRTRLRVWRV